MITLHPNSNMKDYKITDNEWTIILDYLEYLNNMEIIPVLTDDNFIDIKSFDGFSFSSKRVKEISDMIYSSIVNKKIEEFGHIYNDYNELSFPNLCQEQIIYNFFDFLVISNGFHVSIKEFISPI